MKTAIITGISGQDGSYLAELLLSKGYMVIGLNRRTSTNNLERVKTHENLMVIESDLCDPSSINHIINRYKPDEVYNLAAQSHVATSFSQPCYTFDVNAKGPLLLLEAIRQYSPHTKFYQASTSEMFGSNYSEDNAENTIYHKEGKFQCEDTPLSPNSPYAVAKTAAHHLVRVYRDSYKIYACAGILFNHESERRGENFVTRKITKYIGALYAMGIYDYKGPHNVQKLKLGNIDAVRDWGHAQDYVEAMWRMLQQNKPDDYIVGTEQGYSVRDFLKEAFSLINLNWEDFVEIDPSLYRPNEVPYLRCSADKAKNILGWTPKTDFKTLVKKMVEYDIQEASKK